MSIVKKYLLPKKAAIILCVIVIVLQAAAALLLPMLIGNLIGTGIQNSGVDCECPEQLTQRGMRLFELVMPEDEYRLFYRQYEKKDTLYLLRLDADIKEAHRLYTAAVTAGVLLSQEQTDNPYINLSDINAIYNTVSLAKYYRKIEAYAATLDADALAEAYERASGVQSAVKEQIADFMSVFFYDDAGVDIELCRREYVKKCAALMAVSIITEAACIAVTGYLSSKLSADITAEIRSDLLSHTREFMPEQRKKLPGSLESIFSTDTEHIGMIVKYSLSFFLYAPVLSVCSTAISFKINAVLGSIVLLTTVCVCVILAVVFKTALVKYTRMQKNASALYDKVENAVARLYTVRAMRTQKLEADGYCREADELRLNERYVLTAVFTGLTLVSFLANIITVAVVFVGGEGLLNSTLRIGELIAFIQYSLMTVSAFVTVGAVILFAPRAAVSVKAVESVMKTEPQGFTGSLTLDSEKLWTVEYSGFSAGQGNDDFLHNVSFTAQAGKVTAVVGPTGCGKTVLLNSILQYPKRREGSISINGVDIADIDIDFIRKNVSYVGSRPVIFSDTVKNNLLLYGAPDDEQLMLRALKAADVDFIGSLSQRLSNKAGRFSGGQKSRIAIAAALAKQAKLYILDDCFVSLDKACQQRILDYIFALRKQATVIIVSQEADCIENADSVVVFTDKGDTVQGSHDSLLKSCTCYRRLSEIRAQEAVI